MNNNEQIEEQRQLPRIIRCHNQILINAMYSFISTTLC